MGAIITPMPERRSSITCTICIGLFVALLGCTVGHGLGPASEPQKEIGSIRGQVTFRGAWPDSVAEVRVVVYAEYPPSNFFLIDGFSDPIPIDVPEYEYIVLLKPGTYEFVFVVYRKEGQSWLESVLSVRGFLGMYVDPSDSTRPGAVQIEPGGNVTGIDVVTDFDNMGVLPPELEEAIQAQGG